jgi:hypothetical protein
MDAHASSQVHRIRVQFDLSSHPADRPLKDLQAAAQAVRAVASGTI